MLEELKEELITGETNLTQTENGATAYKQTGSALVDLNYSVSAFRQEPGLIVQKFEKAFYEDRNLALKWLFYLGDIRGGHGERKAFRAGLVTLAMSHPEYLRPFVAFVPYYNRWDSILWLLKTPLHDEAINIIKTQLSSDWENMQEGKPISLLAKWLPRTDVTSKKRVDMAHDVCGSLYGKKEYETCTVAEKREYNKTLKTLRRHLKLVETAMVENKWNEIDYSKLPSGANLKYREAFLRHDEERRQQYLKQVAEGKANMNASVLYPYEIARKYNMGWWIDRSTQAEPDIELLWKNLPNLLADEQRNILVVVDGSGSMTCEVSRNLSALNIAQSLAIYCAERINGEFKNYCITFSANPQLVHLNGESLFDNLNILSNYTEISNTNIYKTFKLILDTAVHKNLPQEELPDTILLISDMQFDCGAHFDQPMFKQIKQEFAEAGYKLPNVTFWNVSNYDSAIPVTKNEYGFNLVSGFSPNILKMALSREPSPYAALVETLMSERYAQIDISKVQE